MAQPMRIEPDLQFIEELQSVGGDSLKKCYQCATCSVACPISPQANPYPRKEMIWAQWGLKDKLVTDPDIWLCHNCGACSDLCPRGAKPGDLLSALRNMTYRKLAGPAFLGDLMSSAKGLPVLIGIPAVIWAVIWFIRAQQLGAFFPLTDEGKVRYGELFPGDFTIDPLYVTVTIFVVITFFAGIRKLIKSFEPEGSVAMLGGKKLHWTCALWEVIKDEIATHKKWGDCGEGPEHSSRKLAHLAIFYGFVCLAIVTSVVAVAHWGGKVFHFLEPIGHTPMSLTNPVKILAQIGSVLLFIGLFLFTKRRLTKDQKVSKNSFYDWYLLGVIWVVAVTGYLCQVLRWINVAELAYPMYYVHLISVFMLFAYLPWSKLGHLVYRTAALTYIKQMGRKTP